MKYPGEEARELHFSAGKRLCESERHPKKSWWMRRADMRRLCGWNLLLSTLIFVAFICVAPVPSNANVSVGTAEQMYTSMVCRLC
jgi:hypothetical protein